MEKKYVKVMYGTTSGADKNLEYKINEVNIADNWNPNASSGEEFGGFNYASEECILRWLHRGNMIYDVEVPEDAENVKLEGATVIYRTNKIILRNPRPIDDEVAMYYYKISNIPQKSYYKALGAVAIMDYKNTALQILRDKVNKNNIDDVLEEWNNFIEHGGEDDRKDINETVVLISKLLNEIKSELSISICVEKEPYIKKITEDKVINITGESGSGKTYYTNKYKDSSDYIIIDTDEVFARYENSTGTDREFGSYIRSKCVTLPSLFDDFDYIYNEIIDYFKDRGKTIVIDSAQFRNLEKLDNLKGTIIIMRTPIDTCYNRCIERYKRNYPNATDEEIDKYKEKKKSMYKWYDFLNEFIKRVDEFIKIKNK